MGMHKTQLMESAFQRSRWVEAVVRWQGAEGRAGWSACPNAYVIRFFWSAQVGDRNVEGHFTGSNQSRPSDRWTPDFPLLIPGNFLAVWFSRAMALSINFGILFLSALFKEGWPITRELYRFARVPSRLSVSAWHLI